MVPYDAIRLGVTGGSELWVARRLGRRRGHAEIAAQLSEYEETNDLDSLDAMLEAEDCFEDT
jgi:hypothetical protein